MGIGSKREVNAERVFFYFDDTVCVYPAQNFDDFKWKDNRDWRYENFWKAFDGEKNFTIERNEPDYFNRESW